MATYTRRTRWKLVVPVAAFAASTLALVPAASATQAPATQTPVTQAAPGQQLAVPTEGEDQPANPLAQLLPLPPPQS